MLLGRNLPTSREMHANFEKITEHILLGSSSESPLSELLD